MFVHPLANHCCGSKGLVGDGSLAACLWVWCGGNWSLCPLVPLGSGMVSLLVFCPSLWFLPAGTSPRAGKGHRWSGWACGAHLQTPAPDARLASGCCHNTSLNPGPFSRNLLRKPKQTCLCFYGSPLCCWIASSFTASRQQTPHSHQRCLSPRSARLSAEVKT